MLIESEEKVFLKTAFRSRKIMKKLNSLTRIDKLLRFLFRATARSGIVLTIINKQNGAS